ncbi:response regulator [Litoribrevibacter euphylliae]|uniref:Response regulator n=1 Tax=Litoribrevibacter euphylliae TaxID=1834034 RepID=A0ABV7HGG5_9GAMM
MTVKVLSIDDTPPNQALINKVLSPHFDLDLAMNAEEGWLKLNEFSPDIILLDVNMPGQNGYDFCRVLREDTEKDNVGVIFLSALTSLDERLEGYAAGGDDYVCKPFDPTELKAKIDANSVVRQKLVAAKNFAAQAQSAAFTAMTSSSEMGRVLDFLVHSLQTSDYHEVANHLLSMLKSFDLSGAIAFRSEEMGNQYYSPSGVISPLERELFEQGNGAARIVAHKHLYMFNSPRTSILIKNMPANETVLGRLRDHLAIAVTVVEEKVKSLDVVHQAEKHKRALLTSGIGLIDSSITRMDSGFSSFVDTLKSSVDSVMNELEEHMMFLGLSQEQEASLIQKVKEQHSRLDDLYEQTDDFERELIEASATLRKVLD